MTVELTTWERANDDTSTVLSAPATELWLSNEKAALSVAKAMRYLIREAGGKVGVGRRTDVFEVTDGETVTSRQPTGSNTAVLPSPAAITLPAVADAPKPIGDERRAAARKFVERALLDAEAELATATKQDAESKAANDANRAAKRKQLDELNAEARKARADGQTAKATVAVLAGFTVLSDLQEEYKWAKDTGAATRVRARITTLRKQSIDLRD